jgi:hypothetical protein
VLVVGLAAVPSQAATGIGANFAPDEIVSSFTATETGTSRGESISGDYAWTMPEKFRSITTFGSDTDISSIIVNRGREQTGFGELADLEDATVTRNAIPVEPDGSNWFENDMLEGAAAMLARHRSGESPFVEVTVGGDAMYRGRVSLPANDCAALVKGRLTLLFDARTLLVRRKTELRGGSASRRLVVVYEGINEPVTAGTFDFLTALNTSSFSQGFKRVTPKKADRKVPYAVRVVTYLPDGFVKAVSGWARRSSITGPEGSIPRSPYLFGVVYRRGWERIDITQRKVTSEVWRMWKETSPYGIECGSLTRSKVRVKGARGWYESDATRAPRVYWKKGSVLYTVQGPFPKATLLHIARTLAPPA